MKKIMSLFSSFVFLVGCCAGPASIMPPAAKPAASSIPKEQKSRRVEAVRRIKYLTVRLNSLGPEKLGSLCSAVWVKQGMLLTANHCVDGLMLLSYATVDDESYDKMRLAVPLAQDEENDLAILSVDPSTEPPHDVISLSEEDIEAGEDVDIVGHTVGFEWTYSKGYVSAVRHVIRGPELINVQKVIQISSPAWMGNSGGGAFNENGKLIGICSWISTAGPFLTFFIHRDMIREFLVKQNAI